MAGWVMGWVIGGFMGWVVVGWVVVGFMAGWWCEWWGAWWGGWLESSWGGCIYSPTHEQLQCQNISIYEHPPTHQTSKVSPYYCSYTHPHMNSYDVIIFHFMSTHPSMEHIQSVTLSLYIYFGWLMGWVVGEFMGWVGGCWGGWLKGL